MIFTRVLKFHRQFSSGTKIASRKSFYNTGAIFIVFGTGIFIGTRFRQETRFSGSAFDKSTTSLDDVSKIKYADNNALQSALVEIKNIVGSNFTDDNDSIKAASDSFFSTHHPPKPDIHKPYIIVYPASTEEVSEVLKVAYKYRVPIVANSGLTCLEGQTMHTRGPFSISVSLSRLNKIVEFHPEDLDVTVQAGVGWQDLDEYLKGQPGGESLCFGPDPGMGAAIGGMASTSASGTNAYRYGTMKENVVNMTVVLADGAIIKTKQRPRKSSAGYDLTHLFIGSEGTLGLITELTVKLHVRPAFEYVSIASFPSIKDATQTASTIVAQSGLQLNALEILDKTTVSFFNNSNIVARKFEENPTLLFKIGGPSKESIREQTQLVQKIAENNNVSSFATSHSEEENELLWSARRHGLFSAIQHGANVLKNPNDIQAWATDFAVPMSKLPDLITETIEDLDASGFKDRYVTMGHVGDGNCHFLVLYNSEDYGEAQVVVDRMVKRALALDGTCSGEHGVGVGKRKYLPQELGPTSVDLMRKIKFSMDPRGILNPDKIFKLEPGDNLDELLESGHVKAPEVGCCN